MLGPMHSHPFGEKAAFSPLNTRPCPDEPDRPRVIMDLSFPVGHAVNDGIEVNCYLGEDYTLKYPSVDDLAARVALIGTDCWLYKKDLKRWFHQIPVDPVDIPFLGFTWQEDIYFCRMVPMGLRTACLMGQRITNAVRYIMEQYGFWIINYIDDFPGAEKGQDQAQKLFDALTELFQTLGMEENHQKAVLPMQELVFLGVGFSVPNMTLFVPLEKLLDLMALLENWRTKAQATWKELESLIGKLQFVAKCVRPGRVLISWLLNTLRCFPKVGAFPVPEEARKDIRWWWHFMPSYNGTSIMWLMDLLDSQAMFVTDTTLIGMGAVRHREFVALKFPEEVQNWCAHIAHKELWAILVACKIWVQEFTGSTLMVECDNIAVVQVLNTGRSRDELLQTLIRELMFVTACHEFRVRAKHIPGKQNLLLDLLSRSFQDPEAQRSLTK